MSETIRAQLLHLFDLLDQIQQRKRSWDDLMPQIRAMQREAKRLPADTADPVLEQLYKAEKAASYRRRKRAQQLLRNAEALIPTPGTDG